MKYLTLILAAILNLTDAHADVPSKDRVVAHLQKEFGAAVSPSREQLNFGKYWSCDQFRATPKSSGVTKFPSILRFESVDGVVVNRVSHSVDSFVFSTEGIIGTKLSGSDTWMLTLRSLPSHELIGEWSMDKKLGDSVRSEIDPRFYLTAFVVCRVEN